MSDQTEWSRSQIQDWIKSGDLLVNGQSVKANYKLQIGDDIVVNVPEAIELEVLPEAIPLDIVF